MTTEIEARAYGPDSTPEEIEALRSRVYLHKENVIMFREVPVTSTFQIDVFLDKMRELIHEHGCSFMLVDLTEAKRPSAEFRAYLRKRLVEFQDRIRFLAVFTGKNVLINVAAKFVLSGIFDKFTVHRTLAEAEEAIRKVAG